ncbi:MAG TPA: hypothetical protein DCZ75_03635 [Geobacter sp.]|nr:hypothetical protein [Geobacter sp.]
MLLFKILGVIFALFIVLFVLIVLEETFFGGRRRRRLEQKAYAAQKERLELKARLEKDEAGEK